MKYNYFLLVAIETAVAVTNAAQFDEFHIISIQNR